MAVAYSNASTSLALPSFAEREPSAVVCSARERCSVHRYITTEDMNGPSRGAVDSIKLHSTTGQHTAGPDRLLDCCARVAGGDPLQHARDNGVLADMGFARIDAHIVELDSQNQFDRSLRTDTSADRGADPGSHDLPVGDGRRIGRLNMGRCPRRPSQLRRAGRDQKKNAE